MTTCWNALRHPYSDATGLLAPLSLLLPMALCIASWSLLISLLVPIHPSIHPCPPAPLGPSLPLLRLCWLHPSAVSLLCPSFQPPPCCLFACLQLLLQASAAAGSASLLCRPFSAPPHYFLGVHLSREASAEMGVGKHCPVEGRDHTINSSPKGGPPSTCPSPQLSQSLSLAPQDSPDHHSSLAAIHCLPLVEYKLGEGFHWVLCPQCLAHSRCFVSTFLSRGSDLTPITPLGP